MGDDIRKELVALLPRLRRFAYSLTDSMEEAEDVVQSACEKALKALDQYEPGTGFDSWMFQIVRTIRIDRFCCSMQRPTTSDPDICELIPTEQVEARMELEIIRAEIGRLPEEQRAVLAVVTIDGMTYQKASDTIGVPIGTMSRHARARRKLADALDRPATPKPTTIQLRERLS